MMALSIIAACAVAALLGYGRQVLIVGIPRTPVPAYGSEDPRDFAAALADPVAPRLTLVRS